MSIAGRSVMQAAATLIHKNPQATKQIRILQFAFSAISQRKMDLGTKDTARKESDDGERSSRNGWQELVGLTGEEAVTKIKEESPGLHLQVVGPDHMVTMDYRFDRVRIFVDSEGKVTSAPRIG